MAASSEQQIYDNAKKLLEKKGLHHLAVYDQKALIDRLVNIKKQQTINISNPRSGVSGLVKWGMSFLVGETNNETIETLKLKEEALLKECEVKAYEIVKNEQVIQEEIKIRLQGFEAFVTLSPAAKAIYFELKEKLGYILAIQLINIPNTEKEKIDSNKNLSLLAKLTRQIDVAIELEKEGKLIEIAKSWTYPEVSENKDAYIMEAITYINFIIDCSRIYQNNARNKTDEFFEIMNDIKEKHPEVYAALYDSSIAKMLDLEKRKALASFDKYQSFDQNKYTKNVQDVQTDIMKVKAGYVANEEFKKIQGIEILDEALQKDYLEQLKKIELTRIRFEINYKISMNDERFKPSMSSIVGSLTSSMYSERAAIADSINSYKSSIQKAVVDKLKKEQLDKLTKDLNENSKFNELKKNANDLGEALKDRLLMAYTNKALLERGIWNSVSDTLWQGSHAGILANMKTKYLNGDLAVEKELINILYKKVDDTIQELNRGIKVAANIEGSRDYELFQKLKSEDKIKIIIEFMENVNELNNCHKLEKICKQGIVAPQSVRSTSRAFKRLKTDAEKIVYFQEQLQSLERKAKRLGNHIQEFARQYYRDPYLFALDIKMGRVEEHTKNIMEQGVDLARTAWYSHFNPWYQERPGLAIAGGAAIGILGVTFIGPVAGLVGLIGGAAACYVEPKLTMPTIAAAVGVFVGAIALGGSPTALGVGATVGGSSVVAGRAIVGYFPTVTAGIKKIWGFFKTSKIGALLTYPFRQFNKALFEYRKGNSKFYNGFRMFGIMLGAIVGIAAMVTLNVFTAGLPVIGAAVVGTAAYMGGYVLATTGASLGAYTTKKLSFLHDKHFKQPVLYKLNFETIQMLGKDKEGVEYAIKIGKHFEQRINEQERIVKQMTNRPSSPKHDRELAEQNAYLRKLKKTMVDIKSSGTNLIVVKEKLDIYLKEDYELKRNVYTALYSPNVEILGIKGIKNKQHQENLLQKLKIKMDELAKFSEVSKHMGEVIKQQKTLKPTAAVNVVTPVPNAISGPDIAGLTKTTRRRVSQAPHYESTHRKPTIDKVPVEKRTITHSNRGRLNLVPSQKLSKKNDSPKKST